MPAGSCQLCTADVDGVRPLCLECVTRMDIGQHPIICLGCRLIHPIVALTWVAREQLKPSTVAALDDMEKTINATGAFVMVSCETCKPENPL